MSNGWESKAPMARRCDDVDGELVAMVPYSDMGLGCCNPCRSPSWEAKWVENAGKTPTDEHTHIFSEVDLELSSLDWRTCLRRTN